MRLSRWMGGKGLIWEQTQIRLGQPPLDPLYFFLVTSHSKVGLLSLIEKLSFYRALFMMND